MPDDYLEIGLMLNSAPAAAGAAAAVQSFRAILDVLTDARNEAARLGEQTYKFRDAMRDIQALKGGGPVTEETVQETFRIMRATGQTAAETHESREAFLGESAAYLGKYTPEQREEFQVRAGQYGKMMGIDPETMAKLMGRQIALHPEGIAPEAAQVGAAEFIRRVGMGSGKASLAASSAIEIGSSLVMPGGTGPIADMEALGMLAMGASRLGGEHTIGTTIQSLSTVARGFSSPEWGRHLREDLKIKPGTHVEDAMFKIFEDLEKQAAVPELTGNQEARDAQAQAIAAGETPEGKDLEDILINTYNMRNVRQRRALIGMFTQRRELGRMHRREVVSEEDIPATPGRVQAQVGAYYADEMAGGMAQSEAGAETQQLERGQQEVVPRKYLMDAGTKLLAARRIGQDAMADNALQNMMTKATGLLSHDEALIMQTAREDYERINRVRLPGGEESQTSHFLARTLTGWPMAFEGALNMVGLGGTDWRQHDASLRNWISQRIDPRTVNFAESVQQVRDAQLSDPTAFRTMMGPNAQMMTTEEYRQYGRNVEHWTPQQEAQNMPIWMKRFAEEMTKVVNQGPRPLGGAPPQPQKPMRRQ